MHHLKFDFDLFVGVDVVQELIERLRKKKWPEQFHIQQGDICEQILPSADAILCHDCLVHLPLSKISDAIRLFKKSSTKYLLTTTFPGRENRDIRMGDWRPLNFQADPFWWPASIRLIQGKSSKGYGSLGKEQVYRRLEPCGVAELEIRWTQGRVSSARTSQ